MDDDLREAEAGGDQLRVSAVPPLQGDRGTLPTQAPAVANFIRRFNWTSDDQNSVAYNIAVKHMSNTAAAAAFVNSHQALVKSWLSSSTPFTKTQPPAAGT